MSSPVRKTPSASNSSGPIAFCPPSPRVTVSSAVRKPSPRDEPHQDAVVLVVRVRGHVEHAAGRAHAPQREAEPEAPRSRSRGS